MPPAFFSKAALFLLAFLLSACASLPLHTPVPAEESAAARVPDFPPTIRFWADEMPHGAEHLVAQSMEDFRKLRAGRCGKNASCSAVHFLALSGGGNDGAFGAGFLSGWSDSGERPQFDLVTGVSTGALIAPLAFLGETYDRKLEALFTETKTDNIVLADLWTFLSGLTGGRLALTDVSPFVERIRQTYSEEILDEIAAEHRKGRRLFIGTTNLEAQRGVIWNMGAIAASGHPDRAELFHKIIQASAAIPGVFEPVFIKVAAGGKTYSEIHVDGGVTSQVFLYPIQMPRGAVAAFRKSGVERNLYIIRNAKVKPEYEGLPQPGLFSISKRSVDSLIKNNGVGDLYRLYLTAQRDGAHYHETNIPASFNASSKEMFDPCYMKALFETGRELGRGKDPWAEAPPGIAPVN